ncbi:hypothetical protein CSUI_008972, partial [Cystoisospora suis]
MSLCLHTHTHIYPSVEAMGGWVRKSGRPYTQKTQRRIGEVCPTECDRFRQAQFCSDLRRHSKVCSSTPVVSWVTARGRIECVRTGEQTASLLGHEEISRRHQFKCLSYCRGKNSAVGHDTRNSLWCMACDFVTHMLLEPQTSKHACCC